MSAGDLEIAGRFLETLTAAASTGDREAVYPLLAADVEWVTPARTFNGLDELREQVHWGSPREKLDVEFEEIARTDLGDGQVVSELHEIYRMKETGDFAYARDRRVDLTIREGVIARYEMRVIG